jgi:hypothetical protein
VSAQYENKVTTTATRPGTSPLTKSKRITAAGVFVLLLLFIGFVYFLWWEKQPPPRPTHLPSTAVYYRGLALPFIINKNGDWVYCWFDTTQNSDRCRVTFVDGTLLFQGVFLPYRRQTPVPRDELLIDPEMMNTAQEQVEVDASIEESTVPGMCVVPLVFLRNGEILIPEKAYTSEKKRLDEVGTRRKPSG